MNVMKVCKLYDGRFRVYDSKDNSMLYSFSLQGYPTASSLEKIRSKMIFDNSDHFVTLELRMYEIELPA